MTLNAAEVLEIHNVLAEDFAAAEDPIIPAGLKSMHLLESAVSRQLTGYEGRLKYETAVQNAASLTYGICSNHPFHNGNKRTSLVSMLCHLDKNDLTFEDEVTHDELYEFMLKVARHDFVGKGAARDQSDIEVEQMARWIRKRVRRVDHGERVVTFRQLKNILAGHNLVMEDIRDNTVDLVRYEEQFSWRALKKKIVRNRVCRMPYPSDGEVVGKRLLRDLRERCGLSEKDGIDSHSFYTKSRPVDYFIGRYRRTLRRLARV